VISVDTKKKELVGEFKNAGRGPRLSHEPGGALARGPACALSRGKTPGLASAALANELGIEIAVSHFPPGTSKWNKIEHRLFSFISQNWRARLLVSFA
jgi:hypothetical protein